MKKLSISLSLAMLFCGISVVKPQQSVVLTSYTRQSEIKATDNVMLANGFHIPFGSNARIFTVPYFQSCPILTASPSDNQNYVQVKTFKIAGITMDNVNSSHTVCDENQTIQYFDGLGRPIQTVVLQGSPTFADVVQPIGYDMAGRENKKYMPYTVIGNSGAYQANALQSGGGLASFYTTPPTGVGANPYPFSQTIFEQSPLNRIIEQGAPGAVWQPYNAAIPGSGHSVRYEYETNTDTEVKLWSVTADGAVTVGNYGANKLFKTIIRDENWVEGKGGTNEEFRDFEGRVILRRNWETEGVGLSTYYIYDDLGNLRYVVPPAVTVEAFTEDVNDAAFNGYIFGYHYDLRKRVVEKKIPGKGWEYLVYNALNQIVLSQDAVQHGSGKWFFTKYDALGRVIITGLYDNPGSRETVQGTANIQYRFWEQRDNASASGMGYTSVAFPQSATSYLVINYYDTYDFYNNTFGAPVGVEQADGSRTRGLLTGTRMAVLGTTTMLLKVNNYDIYGRTVQVKNENHLGGTDVVDNAYNFSGELTASTRTHNAKGASTTIVSAFTYDHVGRKTTIHKQINNGTTVGENVLLSEHVYNEIGQLSQKKLHNGIQFTGMAYNEHGWLKSSISGEFSIQLDYQENGGNQWNGNISRQYWSQNSSPSTSPNIFSYGYDKLNRLTIGTSTGIYMSEVLNYDSMGNINQLSRDGGLLNQYFYKGNRLERIDNVAGQYGYDANGNATTDGRNGIALTYNLLNLPSGASGNGKVLGYVYAADGSKLKKTVIENGSTSVREYIEGIEYDGNNIDVIHTEEGVAQRNGDNSYSYHYNLSDHLGNVRYTFDIYNGLIRPLQMDNYYPFGKRNSLTSGNNKYLYNGKEVQDELGGQLDYGARFYDPVIGRWNSVDPMSDKREWLSAYNYVQNNPILRVDPTGAFDWVMDKNNNPYWDKNATSQATTKAGETYLGKSVQYETKEGYGVSLNPDKTWNYQLADLSDKTPVGSRWSDFQSALSVMLPALKTAEVGAEIGAAFASGGIAGGEIGGSYLLGQAARRVDFLGKLALTEARALGVAGEAAVGITGGKTAIEVAGRTRIPDRLGNGLLEEVKNVRYQSFTRQLRDFYQYSQDQSLRMILHTRSSTTLSKPLQALVDQGKIIQQFIPGL